MSEKRELPQFMGGSERDDGLPRAEFNAEEEDVYAQLAQKERDLILAAELGKALLDSNQELQSRYDQMVEEYTHKIEQLQQEKYDLHLELDKMGTEHQNAIKDMQEDVAALRKQARAGDELQMSERERSRSLREAQQNSDYLMEQVKKASLREEELMKELDQLKMKNDSNCATIKDQIDHISMLRDQVEYLSKKLGEINQKIQEIQGEKDVLINTLEMAQENTQILEIKLSEQEIKIQRQSSDIDELQESNAELLQQLQQRQSLQYHQQHQHRVPYLSSRNSKHNSQISSNKQNPNNLYFELNQEKQKLSHYSQSSAIQQPKQDHHIEGQDQVTHTNKDFDKCDELLQAGNLTNIYEQSLFSELTQRDKGRFNNSPSLLAEFTSSCHHGRNTGDCSICCVTEGSRKRHHQNVGGGSDDDASDSGPKQSLYSELSHSVYDPCADSTSSAMDSNGNQISHLISSQFETHSACRTNVSMRSGSADLTQAESTDLHDVLHDSLSESESFPKSCLSHNTFLKDLQENATFGNPPSQFEDTPSSSGDNSEKILSELSAFAHEFYPRQQEMQEQSLFSELSSQLYDDRHGSGSDSSSNCMLGAFDFSGSDAQDVDRNSNESLNRSMEMRSRIESDMSYVTDWYYMTPVTSEMLEEDDFECDDDDFLIGNMAGTTLSISDGGLGLRYNYHGYISRENMADQECSTLDGDKISFTKKQGSTDHNTQQVQLSEACRQLKELVIRVQSEGCPSVSKTHVPYEDYAEAGTDVLLSLVAEMKVCIDRLSAQKDGQLQSSDISTTLPATDEVPIIDSSCNTECLQYEKQSFHHQKHHMFVADWHSFIENGADARNETRKQMRKSKSSSSLI